MVGYRDERPSLALRRLANGYQVSQAIHFFAAVPPGHDAYLLKSILHDWQDERVVDILRICREAMGPKAMLLVIERTIVAPNEGADSKFSDFNMLVDPGGQERTREEYGALFAAARFRLREVAPAGDMSVYEGIPA